MAKPRWMKSKDERLNDTLDYIGDNINLDVQRDKKLFELMAATGKELSGVKSVLGGLTSIGATGSKDDRATNREARRAKRAVMLMSAVYINDPKVRQTEINRVKRLPETNEQNLLAELKSWFTDPAVTPAQVASHAVDNVDKMPKWNNLQISTQNATRGKYFKNGGKDYEFNCYNGVVFWAFQAGAISRRWLWNEWEGKDGNAAFPIFSKCGWTTEIQWEFGKPHTKTFDNFNDGKCTVPAGLAVYFVTPYKVFGHVGMAIGDGKMISQNAVDPNFKDKILPESRLAVTQMQAAETHVISIRQFWDIHYNPYNGYKMLQTTTTPFWEAYDADER